ncbi:MAG: SAM-dependent methyltransferase [Candidatus Curtissbacteria bacterium]|nr:SAM-dependent methyltransferase [Candidatus Curtissbacteria bacterium]
MEERILTKEASSFRDPSGFVFYHRNTVFRQVNISFKDDYNFFKKSNLFKKLINEGLLIPFKEVPNFKGKNSEIFATLKSEKIPFISYPFEWCFEQLKDAALCTLRIQKLCLSYNISLKDASAYNTQFLKGKPIMIDLLSFERYHEGSPWIAYRQFCEHFLGPLLLMSKVDSRLELLLERYLDGIPIDLTSRLLPKSTYLNLSILAHIHLHARNQKKYGANSSIKKQRGKFLTKTMLLGIIDNLESLIGNTRYSGSLSEWGEYSNFMNYSNSAFTNKKKIVKSYLLLKKPKDVWDLGANTGEFSRIASDLGILTVSFDYDLDAVNKNYMQVKKNGEKNVLPLLLDLVNPTPALGWAHEERKSLLARGPSDLTMALALIHHLSISKNIPFGSIASYFAKICKSLIIEFVPKEDDKVQLLLQNRKDIFPWYNQKTFESEFAKYFRIVKRNTIGGKSLRILYLMEGKR